MSTKDLDMESFEQHYPYCFLYLNQERQKSTNKPNVSYSLRNFTKANKLWLQGAFLVM